MKKYIDEVRNFSLSPEQELHIYARFLEKRQRSHFLSRMKYYSKLAVYSLGLVMIFGTTLFSLQNGQPQELYTRIFSNGAVDVLAPNPGLVHADTIGTIVSLEGDASLTRDGKEYPLQEIFSDTPVILKPGAILTFQTEGGLQTQLMGPAQFQLHREIDNNGEIQITLDIIQGQMIQVESTISPEAVENNPTTMTIKTSTVQISALRSDKKVKLHIDTSHKNALIANQGDTVMIKTKDTENGVVVASLQPQQMVIINDQGKLEEEIMTLTKKVLIGDQELSLTDMFAVTTGDIGSGTMIVSDTGMVESGIMASGEILVASTTGIILSGALLVENTTGILITTTTEKKPTNIEINTIDNASGASGASLTESFGSKQLLSETEFSELKSQLYAPKLQQSLRMMMIAYTRADYQSFLSQKKDISRAIFNLYRIVGFEPHIRVIASDPQLAVSQYQSLMKQLLLNIDRSRGISSPYMSKMLSIEVMFLVMKSVGYGKFVDSGLSDDEIWKMIGDEVRKVGK